MKRIGLDKLLPEGWQEKGVRLYDLDAESLHNINSGLSGLGSSLIGGFVLQYVFTGVKTFIAGRIAAQTLCAQIASGAAGLVAGLVIGAAAFVIMDMIASAITGAIERRQLNEAIDTLREVRARMNENIGGSQLAHIAGIYQEINDGVFPVDKENHIYIKRMPDGSYALVKVEEKVYNSAHPAAKGVLQKSAGNVAQFTVLCTLVEAQTA